MLLQVFLGSGGPGSILLGSSLLPKIAISDAQRYARSYTTQLLTAMRDTCTQALMILGSTAPKPEPAPKPKVEPQTSKVELAPEPQTDPSSDQSPDPGSIARFGFGEKPRRYTSPAGFGFQTEPWGEAEFKTDSWKELLPLLCTWLAERTKDKMQEACISTQFQGYKKRTLNLDGCDMQNPAPFESEGQVVGYVETASAAKNVLNLAAKILRFCDIDASTAWYEYEN